MERLASMHERQQFRCGHESLDNFLKTLVTQYERRRLGATYVAVQDEGFRVGGYYTLVAGSISHDVLPPTVARRFLQHPLAVAMLGRLAVGRDIQGKRLGRLRLL